MLKPGDLVFHDDWYGIVSNLQLKTVLMGNGCDEKLNDDEFAALQPLGRNSFPELMELWKLRYDQGVKIVRTDAENDC